MRVQNYLAPLVTLALFASMITPVYSFTKIGQMEVDSGPPGVGPIEGVDWEEGSSTDDATVIGKKKCNTANMVPFILLLRLTIFLNHLPGIK